MTDSFALLQQPRRPWLDPEALKQRFLALSATCHPDKVADGPGRAEAARRFAELNTAFQRLSDPKARLLHLLELETGARPPEIQSIPPVLADLFIEVATVGKEVDHFLSEKKENLSPLLGVQLFERAQAWIERIEVIQKKLAGLRATLDQELRSLDEQWMKADGPARRTLWQKVEDSYRLFGYFGRWNNQLQERKAQLTL